MKKPQIYLLYTISFLAIIAMFFSKPITQSQDYHNFADDNYLLNVNNFWNVFSNLPFVIIGIYGLFLVNKSIKNEVFIYNYYCFFVGIILTGFGSAYYHYNPNDASLIWDRLPMTISFMSFFTIIIGTFIDENFAKKSLYYLLSIGLLSIIYWKFYQDLRMYLLVQFLPIGLLFIILLLSNKNKESKKYFLIMVSFYIFAKILENNDLYIYNLTNKIISGHSLKHFSAGVAALFFYFFIKQKFIQNQKQ